MIDLSTLRRFPDIEASNLVAVDAADRLLLDEAAAALAAAAPGSVAVMGDAYGALTIGAAGLVGSNAGVGVIRSSQDSLVGERALALNAELAAGADYVSLPLGPQLLTGATVVLLRLPSTLAELDEIAGLIARHASPDVTVFAGGRIKHMTIAMNAVLEQHFGRLDVTLARQKARVLVAREPRHADGTEYPVLARLDELDLWVAAHGGVFAGAKLDIGTRLLLSALDDAVPDATTAVDLGCGTGIVASWLARNRPGVAVVATDVSAAAVASAIRTADANQVSDRVTVRRDIGLASLADASVDLVVLNPPFHSGTSVVTDLAQPLFADAARVLREGGELWTVFNSSLGYRPQLGRTVGPTREVARNSKFTVTASTKQG